MMHWRRSGRTRCGCAAATCSRRRRGFRVIAADAGRAGVVVVRAVVVRGGQFRERIFIAMRAGQRRRAGLGGNHALIGAIIQRSSRQRQARRTQHDQQQGKTLHGSPRIRAHPIC